MFHHISSAIATTASAAATTARAGAVLANSSAATASSGMAMTLATSTSAAWPWPERAENATADATTAHAASAITSSGEAAPLRQAVADVVGEQVAAQQRERGREHEARIRRPAKHVDAGNVRERQREQRRVAAEHEQQRDAERGGDQPPSLPPRAAAGDAEPQQQDQRQPADEQIVERVVGVGDLGQRGAVRSEVAAVRAEDVGDGKRRQIGRIERAFQRFVQQLARAIGEFGELQGQQQRNGQQRRAGEQHDGEHRQPFAQVAQRLFRALTISAIAAAISR